MTVLNVITESGVVEQVTPHQATADDLKAQVERVVIDSDEVLAKAGDLKKIIVVNFKKIEEARTAIVKPLNDHVKFINKQFKPFTDQLDTAKINLTKKMNAYAAEQHRIREAEAKALREAAETEALERAQAAEERGDDAVASAVLDQAANYDKTPVKAPIARGYLGSSTSVRKTIQFEAVDIKELCKAIGEGKVSSNAVTLNEQWVRAGITKKKNEDGGTKELLKDGYIPGIKFTEEITTAVR